MYKVWMSSDVSLGHGMTPIAKVPWSGQNSMVGQKKGRLFASMPRKMTRAILAAATGILHRVTGDFKLQETQKGGSSGVLSEGDEKKNRLPHSHAQPGA